MNTVMPEWLGRRAQTHPDLPALVTAEKTWTFSSLSRDAERVARYLQSEGIEPGMRVGILSGNCASFALLIHGISRVGAIAVPINIRLTPVEIRAQLLGAGCSFLFTDKERQTTALEAVADTGVVRILDIDAWQRFEEPSGATQTRRIRLDDPMLIIFTSGTTGRAKGATITYGNVWWSAVGSVLNLGLHEKDSWLLTVPLFHISGLSILVRSVAYGIPVILHERFDPKRANDAIDYQGATIVSLVSTMLSRMLDARNDRPFPPSFRTALIGGGPVPPPLLTRALKAQVPLVQTYGLTETASQVATLPPQEARRKAGSAGKPLMGAELKIDAPPGEVGEIFVRGPIVTPGYWGEKKGARLDADGWFATGDLGYMDNEGFLYVVSRRTDLIISGGENIYPAEIEAVLHDHPRVEEAAVVAYPDPQWGEVPVAFVVYRKDNSPRHSIDPNSSAEELEAYCRRQLATYKVPKRFWPLDELPRNAGGKVLYAKLRDMAREMANP